MANPYGYPPRPATAGEVFGYSGSAKEVKGDSNPVQVLKFSARDITPQGYSGVASVHISSQDVEVNTDSPNTPRNGMLLVDVAWQSGIGGGEATVDATQGTFFTIGGFSSIVLTARIVSADEDLPLTEWASKRVEATVNWGGSISPKNALMSLPSFTVNAMGTSGFKRIPSQASSMIALGTPATSYPGLLAQFATRDAADSIKYAVLNPFANGAPIIHGVEFVRFISDQTIRVFPAFELWL